MTQMLRETRRGGGSWAGIWQICAFPPRIISFDYKEIFKLSCCGKLTPEERERRRLPQGGI